MSQVFLVKVAPQNLQINHPGRTRWVRLDL